MTKLHALIALALAAPAMDAAAGCGSAFCSLNTDWSAQGTWTEPGGRFDLRYEFIDQDQPRTHTRNVGVGEIPEHHDEVRTLNRNWIASFDYTFDANWGVTATLPVVDRNHEHIHNHHGVPIDETWDFTRLGDARIVGRYAFTPEPHANGSFGVQFGVKLPTGQYDVANADGDVAERMLQPGTGTTDGILGVFYSGRLAGGTGWFADASVIAPMDEREGYRPGTRVAADVGASYAWTDRVSLLLQLNASWKDRDSGEEAEPEASGGTFVHLSPGVAFGLDPKTRLYAFVQLPLYQYVNGVQLVADWSVSAGLSRRF
ncbi:MAG TPA: transporter [Burkholderiales bacterium]|nr:transporter [Burkholderiales bacterium]